MKDLILVGIGGAFGSMARYIIGIIIQPKQAQFPWNTLLVNVIGSFLVGILAEWFSRQQNDTSLLRSLIIVGFCGGFTTFSSFSIETLRLFKNGSTMLSLVYILSSVSFSLMAVFVGYSLSIFFNKN